jgi:TctA family transporter
VDGIELVPALIGLFSIPETFEIIRSYIKKE